jgi:hypothetical protein
MDLKRVGLAVAALAATGAVAVGMTNADAATTTPTAIPTGTATSGYGVTGAPGASGDTSGDTSVTGDEAAKASAAVTAKDSAVTVTSVRKDPDGSYDVLGSKAGAPVMFDVSADLATVTQNAGHGGGRGGGSTDTPVTGDEAAKASAAVTAKDSAVTVTSVRKDADGSYDVLGSKAGAPVMFDVSADLAAVTQSSEGAGGGGQRSAAPGATSSSSSSSPDTASTATPAAV